MPTLAELGRDVRSTTEFTVAYYSALEKKQKTFEYTFNGTTIKWPVNTTRRCGMTVATLLAALQLIHGDKTSYEHAFMVYVVHMASLSLHQMGKWLCGLQQTSAMLLKATVLGTPREAQIYFICTKPNPSLHAVLSTFSWANKTAALAAGDAGVPEAEDLTPEGVIAGIKKFRDAIMNIPGHREYKGKTIVTLLSELLGTLSVGVEAGRRVLVFTDEKQAQHYYRTASDFARAVTAASRCEHGRRPYRCKDCGGSGICEHNRQRGQCKECRSGQCEEEAVHVGWPTAAAAAAAAAGAAVLGAAAPGCRDSSNGSSISCSTSPAWCRLPHSATRTAPQQKRARLPGLKSGAAGSVSSPFPPARFPYRRLHAA